MSGPPPYPLPSGEAVPEHTPSLTDQQDGRTGSPHGRCRTVLPRRPGQRLLLGARNAAARPLPVCPCRTLGSAPPGSWLSPGPDQHVAAETAHSFVFPTEMFSDKASVPFPDVGEVWSQ